MSLDAMLTNLPRAYDVSCKRNSQGFTSAWWDHKLHLDVADGMIPVLAIVTRPAYMIRRWRCRWR